MWFKAFLATGTLLMVFHLSSAAYNLTQCYHCEYFSNNNNKQFRTNDENCKQNPPPANLLVDCSVLGNNGTIVNATEWQCIKVTGRIEIDEENFDYVKRACSPGKSFDSCKDCKNTKTYETQYGFVKRGKLCICDEDDGCNTANGLALSSTTLVAGIMVIVFSKFC